MKIGTQTIYLLTLSFMTISSSCGEHNERELIFSQKESIPDTNGISLNSKQEIKTENTLSETYSAYLSFLDSLEIKADTNFQKITSLYPELKKATIINIEGFILYTFPSKIHRIYDTLFNVSNRKIGHPDTIFAFYGKKDDADLVVEQWTFKNELESSECYNQIKNFGTEIYSNRYSAFKRLNKYIFIIHTRASRFYWNLKPAFIRFEQL